MRFAIAVVLLFCLSLLAMAAVADSPDQGVLSSSDVQKMVSAGIPLVDIRRPAEWKTTGVIEGSHLLTFFDQNGNYDTEIWLTELTNLIEPEEPFILISNNGNRASQLARFLSTELEFKHVYHLENGINSWVNSGNMVVW